MQKCEYLRILLLSIEQNDDLNGNLLTWVKKHGERCWSKSACAMKWAFLIFCNIF